ncbi:RepB family plasmid replication initiator protein, partial [Acinetobacter baumannii]
VRSLTSVHDIRLYEWRIAWRSTGKVTTVELEERRLKLGIEPNEYKRMGQFKEKVLHLAIDQINKYTDIKAEY